MVKQKHAIVARPNKNAFIANDKHNVLPSSAAFNTRVSKNITPENFVEMLTIIIKANEIVPASILVLIVVGTVVMGYHAFKELKNNKSNGPFKN
jgi:hypothetical protein